MNAKLPTIRVKIWGRWMQGSPSYMTTKYNPETDYWDLVDMNIHYKLKEVKQYLTELFPEYAFIRMAKIVNDKRDYWGHLRTDPEDKRGFLN